MYPYKYRVKTHYILAFLAKKLTPLMSPVVHNRRVFTPKSVSIYYTFYYTFSLDLILYSIRYIVSGVYFNKLSIGEVQGSMAKEKRRGDNVYVYWA